jgi:hypothetical protein
MWSMYICGQCVVWNEEDLRFFPYATFFNRDVLLNATCGKKSLLVNG